MGHGLSSTGWRHMLQSGVSTIHTKTNKISNLTGALGLIITVGGKGPCLAGVPPPLAPCPGPPVLNLSCPPALGPAWACASSAAWSAWETLLGGSGLLRISLRVEVEDDGVKTGDWLVLAAAFGDAVPSLESLFFLEDLLSLPRESCTKTRSTRCAMFLSVPTDLRLWRRNASSLKTTASLLWATRGAQLDPSSNRSSLLIIGCFSY
jgi:hypothetical protein